MIYLRIQKKNCCSYVLTRFLVYLPLPGWASKKCDMSPIVLFFVHVYRSSNSGDIYVWKVFSVNIHLCMLSTELPLCCVACSSEEQWGCMVALELNHDTGSCLQYWVAALRFSQETVEARTEKRLYNMEKRYFWRKSIHRQSGAQLLELLVHTKNNTSPTNSRARLHASSKTELRRNKTQFLETSMKALLLVFVKVFSSPQSL